jgi:pantothenate kinase
MKPAQAIDPALLDAQAKRLIAAAARRERISGERYLVGIAGVPGSGKSTFAAQLLDAFNRTRAGFAALVPMDGFHFTNEQLVEQGLRERKGAPETFDGEAYVDLLRRSRDPRAAMPFPIYDRAGHEPVLRNTPQQMIGPGVRVVLTEGNYLLLNRKPWSELAKILHETWYLQTPPDQAREWILQRHVRGGKPPEVAEQHYNRVDRENTALVIERMRQADLVLKW